MRGRGVLALLFGLAPTDAGEDEPLLLTEPAPREDWWFDFAIWQSLYAERPDDFEIQAINGDEGDAIC
jgi:hypothetical protein